MIPSLASPTEPEGLPRQARLQEGAVLRYVWRCGLSVREGPLLLKAVFLPIRLSEPPLKAAFWVRRKVIRRAARRNRLRRLLREAYRRLRPHWQKTLSTAEGWLLWSWEASAPPASVNDLYPLLQRAYEQAYQKWQRSLFF